MVLGHCQVLQAVERPVNDSFNIARCSGIVGEEIFTSARLVRRFHMKQLVTRSVIKRIHNVPFLLTSCTTHSLCGNIIAVESLLLALSLSTSLSDHRNIMMRSVVLSLLLLVPVWGDTSSHRYKEGEHVELWVNKVGWAACVGWLLYATYIAYLQSLFSYATCIMH